MNAYIVAAAILAQVAKADWSGDVDAVKSAADSLAEKVNGWQSSQGLQGALAIQADYPNLSKAVAQLQQDSGSVKDSDIDVDQINSFVSSITALLKDLTDKAADLSKTGATQIVANDLKELGDPAAKIVSNLFNVVSSDCDKVPKLTGALQSIADGFKSANSAYSNPALSFPDVPADICKNGGSGSGSSAAASSAAKPSSAAGSASPSASKPAGSASASASKPAGSASPSASKPAGSASIPVGNGAPKAAAGLAALGAGAVALLI